MAVITMDFESQLYGGRHPISIILPDLPRDQAPGEFYPANRKFKVLWLLHGTFGDCTDWIRRTNIEVYACEKNLAVVMPSALNTDYVNWPSFGVGCNMYDYLFDELMPMIYNWYPISDKRDDNYIAGLSMGGAGAMIYALNHPEKFAAAGSLSFPLISYENRKNGIFKDPPVAPYLQKYRLDRFVNQMANAGGEDGYQKSLNNTWDRLIKNYQEHVDMPKLYFAIGDKDFLFPAYQIFKQFAVEQGYHDIVFEEEPGRTHEWRFWDKYIERFLNLYVTRQKLEDEKIAF